MIPIGTDYRMTRTPWVNYAIVAVNVALYLLGYSSANPERIAGYMLQPGNPELHQFFTSVFLHAGPMHLIGNMIFLWVFGNPLNDRFGQVGYLAFYIAGGVFAGIGYLALTPRLPVLGASGAISAVTGAYLVLFPRTRVKVLFFFYIITVFEVSSLVFLLFQFLFNMFMTTTAGGGVAYSAHSAGYVFGIVTAAVLLATHVLPRDAFDLPNLFKHWRRRVKYRRMASSGYDAFGGNMFNDEKARSVSAKAVSSEDSQTPESREISLRREIAKDCTKHDLDSASKKYLKLIQIADDVVLPRQQQLDIANHLMASNQHPAAADAYERFLQRYPKYEHIADIYLMLGLVYSRYLHQYDRAEKMLRLAVEQLDAPEKVKLAEGDLERVRKLR